MATEHNAQARTNGAEPLQKDFSDGAGYSNGNYHLNDTNMDSEAALKRIRTAGSISISPELFEKIYLSPQNAVKGDLRKTFANPTPVALIGFLLALTPLSCDLMGWRGAGGNGAAGTGTYFFFGGLLMVLGGVLEFFLGNTFPFVVFCSFGAFWLSFGATLQPFYGAWAAYANTAAGQTAADGLTSVGFNASFAFFLVFMGLLCFIYLICSLRTNAVFILIFFTLVLGFSLISAAFWYNAEAAAGSPTAAHRAARLQIGAGAFLFVTSLAGWYLVFAIMLAALDFPFQLPVGDTSTMIKGYSQKIKEKENMA